MPPTIKAGMTLGALLLSIPAGCICGVVTCYSVGIVIDSSTGPPGGHYNGWQLGIPVGLVVVVVIPVFAIRLFRKRNRLRSEFRNIKAPAST